MAFLRRTACGRSSGRALNVAADRAAHCMSSPLGPRTTPRGCSGRARHVAAAQRNCPRRPPTLRALSFPPRVQSIASAASARCGRPSRPATSGRSCRARASARRRRPAQASPHAPRRESTRQIVLAPAAPRPPLGPAVALPLVISTPHHHHPLSTPHGDGGAGEPAHAAVDTRRARPAGCEPSRRQAALSARRAKGRPSGRRAPPAGGPPAMSFLVAQRTALRRRAARAAEGTCTERRRETRATWQLGGRAAAGRGRRCRSREREGRCPRRDVSARTQRHWKPAQLLEIWLNLPARIKMVEPHYVMHGADPVPESSSARSRAGGRAAPELTRPTAPPPPPTKERGGYGPAAAAASARAGVQRARPPACSGRPRRL